MSEFLQSLVGSELSLLGIGERNTDAVTRRMRTLEQIKLRVATNDVDFFRPGFREVHYRP